VPERDGQQYGAADQDERDQRGRRHGQPRLDAQAAAPRKRAPSSGKSSPRARTAPGSTKAKVLGALSTDGAMTAGDVAKATGLARGTVSTTLTKLAKTGEISKAERGYRLPTPR